MPPGRRQRHGLLRKVGGGKPLIDYVEMVCKQIAKRRIDPPDWCPPHPEAATDGQQVRSEAEDEREQLVCTVPGGGRHGGDEEEGESGEARCRKEEGRKEVQARAQGENATKKRRKTEAKECRSLDQEGEEVMRPRISPVKGGESAPPLLGTCHIASVTWAAFWGRTARTARAMWAIHQERTVTAATMDDSAPAGRGLPLGCGCARGFALVWGGQLQVRP